MKLSMIFLMVMFSFNTFAAEAAMTEPGFSAKMYATLESEEITSEEIDMKTLTPEQLQAFQKAADEETIVWADTILEGEYVLAENSKVELDSVEKVFNEKGQHIAYRIFFGQAAFDLGGCEVDWELMENDPEGFDAFARQNCTAGRIQAGAFVSLDYQFHFRDEQNIEDFSD